MTFRENVCVSGLPRRCAVEYTQHVSMGGRRYKKDNPGDDQKCPMQVLTIFFATFLAGSFFNQVQLVVNDPTSIVRILGAAAPQTASFFMSYLLLLGLTTKPVLFLRIPRERS